LTDIIFVTVFTGNHIVNDGGALGAQSALTVFAKSKARQLEGGWFMNLPLTFHLLLITSSPQDASTPSSSSQARLCADH
jgi:hypothetical protein